MGKAKQVFSQTWLGHKKLTDWFKEYGNEEEFLLMSEPALINKLSLRDKKTSKTKKMNLRNK